MGALAPVLTLAGCAAAEFPAPSPTAIATSTPINYDRPTLRINVNFGTAWIRLLSADIAGLPVSTSEGIHVGSTRDEVLALTHVETTYCGDGDGKPDSLGVEPRTVPGTESLSHPGQEGTDYIRLAFTGDVVTAISSPSSDWQDI